MGIFDRESDVIVNGAPGGTRIIRHPESGYRTALHAGERVVPIRDLAVKLNVDVSDALTGLKALRREADAAVRSLNSVNEAKRERTISDYTTRELTDELARRTGVGEIVIPPHEVVGVTFANGIGRSIAGPARVLINVD
ncbi:BC1881 family protein [Brevibacillus porteri]|uniref:BC1881 family protein n=1 Tax=Brevibacillus porteri TaxID=2126350 RepID=UPI003D195883